jgi:DNA-binding LacI/PurR family transcriptional regulator
VRSPVTIVDVANRAGVAISSVSAALNGRPGVSQSTRQRILDTAQSIGWVPSVRARSLSSKRAFAVGLVVRRPSEVMESDPFFAAFIGGIGSVLEDSGQALLLQLVSDPKRIVETYRQLALERRVDGVFLADIEGDDPRIPLLTQLQLPTVAIDADPERRSFPTVGQDDSAGNRSLMQHLIGLGHRRIAHVSGSPEFVHSRRRANVWRSAMDAAALPPGSLFVGDFTSAGGARAAAELMTRDERPTAVVCSNDLTAIGFIARAKDLGFRVPHDVSVTGHDDISAGMFTRPHLTTITADPHAIGEAATRILLDMIDGKAVEDVAIAPAELIVRESTAPPAPQL